MGRDPRFRCRAWVCVALLNGLSATALAQDDSEQAAAEVERQRRLEGHERARLDAAAEAALFAKLSPSRRVSYDQVLENPDDPEMNFRWAQTQVADGNLTGAAATLQRILLIQPDLPRVRLLYAVVLFRLGSLVDAERELAQLEGQPRARPLAGPIARYRERVRQARRRTRHALTFVGGSQYDTNRNSGPDSNQVLLSDIRFGLGPLNKKTADGGWFSLAQWKAEHDLGRQEDRQLVSELAYFHSQQDDLDRFDVQAVKLGLGLRTRRAGQELYPRLLVDVVDLSRETYLRSVGVEVGTSRPLTSRIELSASASVVHEDFDGIPEAPTASERSGYRSRIETGLSYALRARQRVELSGALTRKSADQSYHAYLGWELGLRHLWVLEQGPFVVTSLSFQGDAYKNSQDDVSRSRRRDLRTRARVSLGLPLGSILGGRLEMLEDLVVGITSEVQLASSNLPNYEFNNRRLSVTLSRRFDF